MDDARRHEAQGHGDEAVEEDQSEGIEQGLDELRFTQDGRVVGESDPRRGADSVPPIEGVLHRRRRAAGERTART